MADELNESAEFGRKHKNEEEPILVAQRFLNIFRQMHIFNKARRDQFDLMLLDMPSDIRILLSTLPGGSLLIEHIEELEKKNGVVPATLPTKANNHAKKNDKDDQAKNNKQVVGGTVVIDASFASELSSSLSLALQQTERRYKEDIKTLTETLTSSIMESQSAIGNMIKDILLTAQKSIKTENDKPQVIVLPPQYAQHPSFDYSPSKVTFEQIEPIVTKEKIIAQKTNPEALQPDTQTSAQFQSQEQVAADKVEEKPQPKAAPEVAKAVEKKATPESEIKPAVVKVEEKPQPKAAPEVGNILATTTHNDKKTLSEAEAPAPKKKKKKKKNKKKTAESGLGLPSVSELLASPQNIEQIIDLPDESEPVNLPEDDFADEFESDQVTDLPPLNFEEPEPATAQTFDDEPLDDFKYEEPEPATAQTFDDEPLDDFKYEEFGSSGENSDEPLSPYEDELDKIRFALQGTEDDEETENAKELSSEPDPVKETSEPIESAALSLDTAPEPVNFNPEPEKVPETNIDPTDIVSLDSIEDAPISLDDFDFGEPSGSVDTVENFDDVTPPDYTDPAPQTITTEDASSINAETDDSEWEYVEVPETEDPNQDWEWEYVDAETADTSDEDWEWEYVEDDGSDEQDWEWEYVEEGDEDSQNPAK